MARENENNKKIIFTMPSGCNIPTRNLAFCKFVDANGDNKIDLFYFVNLEDEKTKTLAFYDVSHAGLNMEDGKFHIGTNYHETVTYNKKNGQILLIPLVNQECYIEEVIPFQDVYKALTRKDCPEKLSVSDVLSFKCGMGISIPGFDAPSLAKILIKGEPIPYQIDCKCPKMS